MKKLVAVMLIVVASAAYAEKVKSKPSKDKQFEPVVRAAAEYAGSYRGPDESYGLILEVAPDGTLRGNYVELGRVAVLHAIVIDGSNFTARASFDDGSWRTISGSFGKRSVNGSVAFGARVSGVMVEGMGRVETFFERLS